MDLRGVHLLTPQKYVNLLRNKLMYMCQFINIYVLRLMFHIKMGHLDLDPVSAETEKSHNVKRWWIPTIWTLVNYCLIDLLWLISGI